MVWLGGRGGEGAGRDGRAVSLRRQRPNLRQRAVDARKRELVALGASELLSHVSIDCGFENLDALKAVCQGVEVSVCVFKGWGGGSEDVLFALEPVRNTGWFPVDIYRVVIEGFAIRSGGQIDELTDNEWGLLS